MSGVYRIFGIHYTDMLDFLGKQIAKHKSLDGYFAHLNNTTSDSLVGTDQIDLMMKVGNLYMSIDTLRDSTQAYWKGIYKSSVGFVAMLVIFIIILFIIIGSLIYFSASGMLKTAKEVATNLGIEPVNQFVNISKMAIVMLCIFLVLLMVFVLISQIMVERARFAINTYNDVGKDVAHFKTSILSIRDEVIMSLKLFIYLSRRSTQSKLLKDLEHITAKSKNPIFSVDDVKNIFNIKTFSVDKALLFTKINGNLKESLTQFYTGGNGENGYQKMKHILISSSNFLMLKEMKASLLYYYYLVEKSKSEEAQETEKNQAIIDSIIIERLKTLTTASNPNNGSGIQPTARTALIQKNLAETTINDAYESLLTKLCYLAYFIYPLYIQQSPSAADFPITNFYQNMPHVLQNSAILGQDYQDIFVSVYRDQYSTYMQRCTAAATEGQTAVFSIIDEMVKNNFAQYLTTQFQKLTTLIKGDYMFVYDSTSMSDAIRSRFQSRPPFNDVSSSNGNYPVMISQYFGDTMIADLWTGFMTSFKSGSMVEELRNQFVSDASTDLLKTAVKSVASYKSYIFEKLQSVDQSIDITTIATYNILLQKIDKLLLSKRIINTDPFSSDLKKNRFITADEFAKKIDSITFRDLTDELNAVYVSGLVQTFYQNISVNSGGNNMRDVYFSQTRRYTHAKIVIIMMCIIIGLIALHFGISVGQDLKETNEKFKQDTDSKTGKVKPNTSEYEALHFALTQKKWFLGLKVSMASVAVFFIIALFISFLKNIKDKNDFNRETIEANTASLKDSLNELNLLIGRLTTSVTATGGSTAKSNTSIGKLTEILPSDKEELYNLVVNVIERYEKCNYINTSGNVDLQFPFAEASMSMFMILIATFAFYYITMKLTPLQRIQKIKELNIQKTKIELGLAPDIETEIAEIFGCHLNEMDAMMFALKIIMFFFILVFLIFYSILVLTSSSNFKNGLYNSRYFEQSKCYDL